MRKSKFISTKNEDELKLKPRKTAYSAHECFLKLVVVKLATLKKTSKLTKREENKIDILATSDLEISTTKTDLMILLLFYRQK